MQKVLHGHGLRDRLQQGPQEIGGSPAPTTVKLRRYRCTACGSTCAVGPRYHYNGAAIVYAFGLIELAGLTIAQVRKMLCAWQRGSPESLSRWRSVRRWLQDIADGRLFFGLALVGADIGAGPALMERVAQRVLARAPEFLRRAPLAEKVFLTAQEIWLGRVGLDRGG